MEFQMGDIETQAVCYEDRTVAHRRQPISHQPQFSFEQLTELVRRWNAFEKDGLVDELRAACDEGLAECERVKMDCKCKWKNLDSLLGRIERIEAAIAKVKA